MLSILLAAGMAAQSAPGQILIDRGRVDRAPAPAVPATSPRAKRPKPNIAAAGSTTPIAGIRFVGAKAPGPVAEAAQAFLGKPASTETLQDLAAVLSAAYGDSAVALYTVAIPEQDFAGGVVTVSLTEGRIVKASVKGKPSNHRLLRARLAPLLDEAPLSRARFERQVSLIREIPGLTFDTEFADPEANGALALSVTPKQRRRKFSLGFSNRGVDLLGDGQYDAKAEFYGLGVNGDQLSFNASAATDLKRFRYGSLAYAAPLTASGLSFSATGAYLDTRPAGTPIVGRAKLAGAQISYPLVRDFHHSADLSLGVDGLDSDNAVFGNLLATERTRAVRAAAGWSMNREKRALSVNGSLSQGFDIFGARVTYPLAEARFLKAVAGISAAQQIGTRTVVRLNANGQYSRDRLPAAERYAIGGETIGRAFDTSLLTGDRGAGGLAEIAYRPIKGDRFGLSEVYSFVDGGVVGILPRAGLPRLDYSLASAGVGVRARLRDKAELGLEAARSIDDPYPGYADDWRFSLAYRLTL